MMVVATSCSHGHGTGSRRDDLSINVMSNYDYIADTWRFYFFFLSN